MTYRPFNNDGRFCVEDPYCLDFGAQKVNVTLSWNTYICVFHSMVQTLKDENPRVDQTIISHSL